MKVVLLAGGFGTRISEESHLRPKPMIEIGEKPILWHIMKQYSHYGFNDFVICAGYKQHVIKEFFADYFLHTSDITFDLQTNSMEVHDNFAEPWKVTVVDTGLNTMTGGRVKRIRRYVGDEPFLLTYGDGVSDVDIGKLVEYHKQHGKYCTMTATNIGQRFGVLEIEENGRISGFREKSDSDGSMINAGFMAVSYTHLPENSEFNYVKEVDYISGCSIMIRAQLWKQLGGFDERFAPAYCEDSDLAFQVRAAGYQVLYQPLSVVTHYEGVSNGTDVASGQKQYQIVNKKRLFEKWKNVLQKEHFKEGENVFRARERSAKKPCLLMVDHYVPTYDQDAGSRTVFEYLKLFVKIGYDVKFIPDNFNRSEPYTTTLQQMGIEVLYGPWYAQHWKEWVLENARQIEYVFLNRPHILSLIHI